MGMMQGEVTGGRGAAYSPGRASFSIPDGVVIAHELGHNMSLLHAPCRATSQPDDGFPYTNGGIGAWGYDFATNRVVEPHTPDFMSYCRPPWVSDYSFTKALHFRLEDEANHTSAVAAQPARALLLWGGVDSTGVPYLKPAFIVEAEPALPASGGDYRITGRTEGGDEVFSLAFDMLQVADGAGDSQGFGFALPVQSGWAGNLASITLTGPGGSATLDKETDQPMTILRNPQTGQVRGFLRNLGSPTQAAMDAVGGAADPGLEMLFSRGVPDERLGGGSPGCQGTDSSSAAEAPQGPGGPSRWPRTRRDSNLHGVEGAKSPGVHSFARQALTRRFMLTPCSAARMARARCVSGVTRTMNFPL